MQYLVMANVAAHAPGELIELLMKPEARRVWDLYVGGVVRSVWYRADKPGAVLLLEAATGEDAERAVASLPMVEAGLLDIEIVPLSHYGGFGSLFDS